MKRLLMMIICISLMVLAMPQANAKDYWGYSDKNGHTYCDSNSLKWDADGRYCEVRAKLVVADGTPLNPELLTKADRRGQKVLDWCRKIAGK